MRLIKELKRPPLHAQVTEALRNEILARGKPGEKLASEDKFAKQLGVSVLTLRHSLVVLAQEGLIERRHGSGTFVADRRKHQNVAICTITFSNLPMTSFQTRLFFMLGEKFQRAGYSCRLHAVPMEFPEGWNDYKRDLERGLISGAAFIAMNPNAELLRHGVPYIAQDGSTPMVAPDYNQLLRDGIRHLRDRGCKRIALMDTSNILSSASSSGELRAIMAASGLPLHEEWVRSGVSPNRPGAGWEQFREVWTSRREKPDGLLVTDDMLFRDVAMAILECGIRVPRQLKVVAHANKGSGLIYPFPISRLEVDLDEWAEAMMHQLIKLMNHEPVEPRVHFISARLLPAETGPEARLPGEAPAAIGEGRKDLPGSESRT